MGSMLYIRPMFEPSEYTVAEAQKSLPKLVERVGSGTDVLLLQGERCVAVLVSPERYTPVQPKVRSFKSAYGALLARFPDTAPGIGPGHFRTFRARDLGAKVAL
jgi:antitoxin (DNA-binding transcriptional repressor) of toxin-antitoxin stability system